MEKRKEEKIKENRTIKIKTKLTEGRRRGKESKRSKCLREETQH